MIIIDGNVMESRRLIYRKMAFRYSGKVRLHSGCKLHLFTLETRKIFRYFYVIKIAEKAMLLKVKDLINGKN
jgi:hypothetical protein